MFEFTTLLSKFCSFVIGLFLIIVVLLLGATEISNASLSSNDGGTTGDPNIITSSLTAASQRTGMALSFIGNATGQATYNVNHVIQISAHQTINTAGRSLSFMDSIAYQTVHFPINVFSKSIAIVGQGILQATEFLANGVGNSLTFVTNTATQTSLTTPSDTISIPVIEPITVSSVALPDVSRKIPTPSLPATPVVASVTPPLPIQPTLANTIVVQTTSADNLYAWGNCTWWVFIRRSQIDEPIPNSWGNASSWAASAKTDGYLVDHQPSPGAIMQLSGVDHGLGHVAFVESVDLDGTWHISEMNVRGLDVVDHRSEPASAAAYYNFIHNKV